METTEVIKVYEELTRRMDECQSELTQLRSKLSEISDNTPRWTEDKLEQLTVEHLVNILHKCELKAAMLENMTDLCEAFPQTASYKGLSYSLWADRIEDVISLHVEIHEQLQLLHKYGDLRSELDMLHEDTIRQHRLEKDLTEANIINHD